MKNQTQSVPVNVIDVNEHPLADFLGIPPELLVRTRRCCDRPRGGTLLCGHCGCRSEFDDCPSDPIWKPLPIGWEGKPESWCGCDEPGEEVLPCGHCNCGEGLCVEYVNVGKGKPFEKRRKAACA